jgi:single stranded DNA-binding protein
LRLATSDFKKDKSTGEKREITEWHRVVLFGRLAAVANDFLRKGSPAFIEGRLRSRSWKDKNGQDKTMVEIEASVLQLLGDKPAPFHQAGLVNQKNINASTSDGPLPISTWLATPTPKEPEYPF